MRIPEHKADMCRSDRIIWNVPERSRTFQNEGGALRTRGARSARARTACCFRQRAAALPPRSRARAPAPLRHSCRAAGDSQLLSLSGQLLSPLWSTSLPLFSASLPLFPSLPLSNQPRPESAAMARHPAHCGGQAGAGSPTRAPRGSRARCRRRGGSGGTRAQAASRSGTCSPWRRTCPRRA